MSAAEDTRREAHRHGDSNADAHEMWCGSCGRSWCFTCHPTPAALCPWENGDERGLRHDGAVIHARRSRMHVS